MRTEAEMMELILNAAKRDERVRVVGMNGSRANPKAKKDAFQDYDVVFLVTEMAPFVEDESWLAPFGPRLITQTPEAMELFPPSLGGWFTYLMQFEDGNRIDLMLVPLAELEKYLHNDTMTVILLDKDGRVPPLPAPSDSGYFVKKPTARLVDDCCNEFWWVAPYVAKGLRRGEFLYAADHIDFIRKQLLLMLTWRVGAEHDYAVNVGKSHKYLQRYVDEETWGRLVATFNCAGEEKCWQALFGCADLFGETSAFVAGALGAPLPNYGEKVLPYLRRLHAGENG